MKFRNIIIFAILLFALNLIYFYTIKNTRRNPAGIEATDNSGVSSFNYDTVDVDIKKVKEILLSGIHFKISKTNTPGIFNGVYQRNLEIFFSNINFLTDPTTNRSFCEIFQNIEVIMVAKNIVISGEPPSIRVLTTCKNSENSIYFNLPIDSILSLDPSDGLKKLPNYSGVYFSHFDDNWPTDWIIKRISFYNEIKFINISNFEISLYLTQNINFSIKQD